ncbi:MAG: hypothetical protein WD489_03665 [Rhodovibrionaceae bacterium]
MLMLKAGALTREVSADWDFLWPLVWVSPSGAADTLRWLSVACFLSSLLALHFSNKRSFRLFFILLFLPACTIPNSLGGINHPYHAWFWIGVCFVFLPDVKRGEISRHIEMSYLLVISTCQALLLFFYSLAGFWKLVYGLQGLFAGYEGNFSPRGLALTLADRMLQTGTDPLLANFFIVNYWLSWPMFIGVIYIQFVAVLVAFRPRLHALWGYLLIFFHLGTYLLMEIGFSQHVLFLALLFVMSPFRPMQWSLPQVIGDLPIVGLVYRRVLTRFAASAPGRQVPAR